MRLNMQGWLCCLYAAQPRGNAIRSILYHGIPFPLISRLRTAVLLAILFAGLQSAIPAQVQSAFFAPIEKASGASEIKMPQNETAPSGSGAGFRAATSDSDSGQPGGQTDGAFAGSSLWNHLLLDAFQLGMRSGNFLGAGGKRQKLEQRRPRCGDPVAAERAVEEDGPPRPFRFI
jgi:hypothetical protein